VTRPLLLIACSGRKLAGTHRAIDLYQGVMFDVLRKWMPAENQPDVYIISAKHGLVHADALVESYEQPMTEERQRELIAKGLDVAQFEGKAFNEVFIAGGALYRAVADVYVALLRTARFLEAYARVRATSGGIGEQRGQLGVYLRTLGRQFKAGDMLVRREPMGAVTDQITLLQDVDHAEAKRVRTPAEGTLHIKVEFVGERQKINHRWQTPITHGLMDNEHIVRDYVLKADKLVDESEQGLQMRIF